MIDVSRHFDQNRARSTVPRSLQQGRRTVSASALHNGMNRALNTRIRNRPAP
jgi:hypothetical protein